MTEKDKKASALICTAGQIKNYDKLARFQPITMK